MTAIDIHVRGLLLSLDRDSRLPLRRQLEAELRGAIRTGRLGAGTRLPASRDLARQLGVSRGVVADAYAMLQAQGYLVTRERAAPVVAETPSSKLDTAVIGDQVPGPTPRFDFVATTPDVSLFNRRAWARAIDHALRTAPDAAFDYGDDEGAPQTRQALCEYLGRVRAVVAAPGDVVMVQGYSQAIDLACRALSRQGATRVAFESPSHDEQWETARRAGLTPVAVPVDRDGICVDDISGTGADAVVVTPAHQFPTGGVLSGDRRRGLLRWATGRGALVIEDDYDSEFRYDRSAVGAIQGLDPLHVLHIGTLSKTLAPALRLGWAVVPGPFKEAFVAAKLLADAGSPTIEQLAFAHLLTSGAYEREVHRARGEYRARRDLLLTALSDELPDCTVHGIAAGLHVLLGLPPGLDEVTVTAAAAARRIRIQPLGDFKLTPDGHAPSLLLGYGRLSRPAIAPAVRELAAAIRSCRGSRGVSRHARE